MRISAGSFKGRKIGARKLFSKKDGKDDLRPTSAKVREALFDILRNDIDGASMLDLYAGTGTIGIEALSRGARQTVFVESVRSRAKEISRIIDELDLGSRAFLYCEQASMFLKSASMRNETFDIIFIDPPYASDELVKVLPLIDEYGILNTHGAVVCEYASKTDMPEQAGSLGLIKKYRYGDTSIALYRKEP